MKQTSFGARKLVREGLPTLEQAKDRIDQEAAAKVNVERTKPVRRQRPCGRTSANRSRSAGLGATLRMTSRASSSPLPKSVRWPESCDRSEPG